jgi:uncharacterized repeat protein (TIGR03803 family)
LTTTEETAGQGTVFALTLPPATPVLTSAAMASGSITVPFSYQVTATNLPTNYSATNLPDGLSINPTSGLINGTPTTVETHTVTLTLTNAVGSSNVPLVISIGALPVPVVTGILTSYGSVEAAFSYNITASNNATSYSASGLSGTGLSLDPASGIISGTPTSTGTIPVSVTATNATGTSSAAALSIQILAAPPTLSEEYNVLHRFGDGTVTNDGNGPLSLIQGFDGNYYGISANGGASNQGAVFKMTEQGVVSIFYAFSAATGIESPTSLIQAADGNFYGTTSYGQIFKLTPSGQLTVLYSFGHNTLGGSVQLNSLIQGYDGNFYGTTVNDGLTGGVNGSASGFGTVFKITPQGTATILHTFNDGSVTSDGIQPNALVQGSDGNFYGTTRDGGTQNEGVTFKITPQGVVTILHSFGSVTNDGAYPYAALIEGDDGNFYGTTTQGGSSESHGTAFQMTPLGVVTILHAFGTGALPNDGQFPYAPLIQGYDGNFYGTTENGGTVDGGTIFQITPQETTTIIHNFADGSVTKDGTGPSLPLIQGADGNFYGLTAAGGDGDGTIYSIDAAQTPTHAPIYIGSAYEESSVQTPFSFTPKAAFGVSGSGVENGNAVQAQTGGNGIVAALLSLLPQTIHKSFPATNWTLTGTLPNYLTFDPTSGTISGTPVQGGTFTLTMTPYNALGPGTAMTVTLYIDVPPGINSAVTTTGTVGTPFSYQIEALPPADSYSATALPGWLSVDPVAGIISGTPPTAGTYVFNAIAANISGTAVQPVSLTVTGGATSVPTITSATTANGAVGATFTDQIATNPSATSFTALALPTGLVFNATSGTIFGTPSEAGTFTIPLTASNANGTYASVLSLTIAPLSEPGIASTLSATVAEGVLFSYQIPSTGIVSTYTETGPLPTGLSFNALTGVISGTTTAMGAFPVSVSVGNASGTNSSTLTLNVVTSQNFSQWETSYNFNSPASATPENDGVPNLIKYLCDINPTEPITASEDAALPLLGSVTSEGNQYVTLTYRQYILKSGITVYVQTSSDLQNWTTVNPPDFSQQLGTDPNTSDPIIEVGVKASGTSKQFVRLILSQP